MDKNKVPVLHLNNIDVTPPNGWQWHPGGAKLIRSALTGAAGYRDLMHRAVEFSNLMGWRWTREQLEQRVQHQICSNNPGLADPSHSKAFTNASNTVIGPATHGPMVPLYKDHVPGAMVRAWLATIKPEATHPSRTLARAKLNCCEGCALKKSYTIPFDWSARERAAEISKYTDEGYVNPRIKGCACARNGMELTVAANINLSQLDPNVEFPDYCGHSIEKARS